MTKPKWLSKEKKEKIQKNLLLFWKNCKDYFTSLHMQLVLLILVGAIISTSTYIICRAVIILFVEQQYTSESARADREQEHFEDLENFLVQGGATKESVAQINEWMDNKSFLLLVIYDGDTPIYRSDLYYPTVSGLTVKVPSAEELYYLAENQEKRALAIGDHVYVAMAEYSEYFYYDMANLFSVVAAIIVLAFTLILYFQRVTKRISRLARDVRRVSAGEMNHRIRSDELQDEISRLCTNVENMRSSIVRTLEKEREAINANADLITSMSHDIRTPLTVLLGYLDVMKLQAKDDSTRQYIRACEQTALRLKKLSDDMFQYFLVFAGDEGEQTLQTYDALTLLEQMLSEHVILLKENGFSVEIELSKGFSDMRAQILTDAPQCMRIIDNLFSNIMKYTDKSEPIRLSFHENKREVTICFSNAIRKDADLAESTGIGLRTCARIAGLLGCVFATEERDDIFTARLALPKSEEEL